MAKSRPSASAEPSEHPLANQLERIADELQLVREVLDEIRTDFQWAVQNGRVQLVGTDKPPAAELLPPITLFDEGDAVNFIRNGQEQFGEIVSVDDARNEAVVLLIPSNETIAVSQDGLTKVEPDQLRREPTGISSFEESPQVAASQPTVDPGLRPPGNLF